MLYSGDESGCNNLKIWKKYEKKVEEKKEKASIATLLHLPVHIFDGLRLRITFFTPSRQITSPGSPVNLLYKRFNNVDPSPQ